MRGILYFILAGVLVSGCQFNFGGGNRQDNSNSASFSALNNRANTTSSAPMFSTNSTESVSEMEGGGQVSSEADVSLP